MPEKSFGMTCLWPSSEPIAFFVQCQYSFSMLLFSFWNKQRTLTTKAILWCFLSFRKEILRGTTVACKNRAHQQAMTKFWHSAHMQCQLILSDYGGVNLFHYSSTILPAGGWWQNWEPRLQQLYCCFHWETVGYGNTHNLALHKQINHRVRYRLNKTL